MRFLRRLPLLACIELATPEIGEAMTVGQARSNRRLWVGLK
jgi:hypothetical protein